LQEFFESRRIYKFDNRNGHTDYELIISILDK
jgi:hypothetical protein